MNAKISVFFICVEVIIYLLLYNLHDYLRVNVFPVCISWDDGASFKIEWKQNKKNNANYNMNQRFPS